MTRQQIADLISEVSDLAATLRDTESETAAEVYRQLGLHLSYYPDKQIVRAAAAPQPDNIGKWLVSEGGPTPYPHIALCATAPKSIYSRWTDRMCSDVQKRCLPPS